MPEPADLYICPDRILWLSNGFRGGSTQRPAPALLIGAFAPLKLDSPEGGPQQGRAFAIAPQVERSIDAEDAGFFSLNLDPVHPQAAALRQLAAGGIVNVSARLPAAVIEHIAAAIRQGPDCAGAIALTDTVLANMLGATAAAPVDARVRRVAGRLQADLPPRPPLAELARSCGLSPGRISHLFRAEAGVAMRSYLLWLKMQHAAALFARDWSMTDVAAEIGFADAAHLARVFRDYFSVNPSWLADRAQVRVHSCPAGSQ